MSGTRRGSNASGWALVIAVTLLVLAGPGVGSAVAAAGDIGAEDFSYAPASGSLSGTKPESKLWFNEGGWWGVLYSPSAGRYRIEHLGFDGAWHDAGVDIDSRVSSRADALWDAATGKLYVASHKFVNAGHSTGTPAPGDPATLQRFTYHPESATYTLDLTATINDVATETLVIDKDSTGTLWATWTYGQRVYVAHTTGSDDSWGAAYVVPGSAMLDRDDISSLVAFGGNRIGVMWSDQSDGHVYFSVHGDGANESAWATEQVPTGWSSDDHINLKADAAGRVFAAVKTSEESGSSALILLLVRDAGGTWTHTTFGTVSDSHTRPIVLLDEQHGLVHMFATCPQPPKSSGQSGGDICEKTAPMNTPTFSPGIGTAIIRDAGSPMLNDATSTKQNVDGASGIVVLANNHDTDVYWHASESLGPPPPALRAEFAATPSGGVAPLSVIFQDASAGGPTSWLWTFGDGATSTERSPAHVYAQPGTYSVTLRVANGSVASSVTHPIAVTAAAPVAPSSAQQHAGSAACARPRRVVVRLQRVRHGRVSRAVIRIPGRRPVVVKRRRGRLPKSVTVTLPLRTGTVRVTVRQSVVDHRRHLTRTAHHLYRACLG